jgi:hypothetical protein
VTDVALAPAPCPRNEIKYVDDEDKPRDAANLPVYRPRPLPGPIIAAVRGARERDRFNPGGLLRLSGPYNSPAFSVAQVAELADALL